MLKAEVRRVNGLPRLFVNDEEQVPLFLFVNTEVEDFKRLDICAGQIQLAAQRGIHLHSVCCHVMVGRPAGQRGVDTALQAMRLAIDNDPQAMILLRVNLSSYGEDAVEWEKTHPGDGVRYALCADKCRMDEQPDGSFAEMPDYTISIASEDWLVASLETMQELVSAVKADPELDDHLLGYHMAAEDAGEWFLSGVREWGVNICDANQRKYREWLQNTYGDIVSLCRAWCLRDEAYSSFDEVTVPADIPGNDREKPAERTLFVRPEDRRYLDYCTYCSWLVTERILQIAKATREMTGGEKLQLFFYGYYYELYDARLGHFNLNALLDSPYLDAFASPISYIDRNQGGTGAMMAPVDSILLHGKLWFVESDLRTGHVMRSHTENDYTAWLNVQVDSMEHLYEVNRRECAQMLVHGLGCWYMDLMGSGWLYHPLLWAEIEKLYHLYQGLQPTLAPLQAEVALVVDEQAMGCVAHAEQLGAKLLHNLRQNFYRAGIKLGWYTVEDVENGLVSSARVIWVFNPFAMSEERLHKLHTVAQAQNASLVFMHGFGRTDPVLVENYTGLRVSMDTESMENLAMEATFLPAGKHLLPTDEDMCRQIESPYYHDSTQIANPSTWVEPGEGVEVLATYTTGRMKGKIGAARCVKDGVPSVFVGALQLTADGIRELCRLCGAHIYCETNDAMMIGDRILAIHTTRPGSGGVADCGGTTIKLRRSMALTTDTGAPVEGDALSVPATPFQTHVWLAGEENF